MITKDRQYRNFEYEVKEEGMIVEGMPIVFDSPTVMFEMEGIKYYEVVDRNALRNADMSDVVFVENHSGTPGARTKNKTLELSMNDSAMYIRADLSKSSKGPAMYSDIKSGTYDKMSFSFTVRKDSYDKQTRTRTILEIDRLFDVSCVTFPAYSQTTISARSFFEAEVEKERMELRELELRRKKLNLLLKTSRKELE
jgi:HK97 family phage prohead protease